MTSRAGLAFVCLASFPLAVYAADAVASLKKLEAARAELAKAAERIKPDPPSNADLDAAHAAVEALKVALDSGAELEQSDLDYAKSALAARKELRTQRDYVEQRRAKVKIFDARRAIDAGLKTLNEAGSKLAAKEPPAQSFANLRSAADAVKKLADDARGFAKQDAAFEKYLAETDAAVAKQLRAADDRETVLAVEKQRAQLDAAQQALKAAAAAVGKDASDEQFKAVDKAASDLAQKLDEGKPLEAKNKAYQTEAGKLRAELAATKKKVDEVWTATGLARLKAEIEPQYKDLIAASKPLRGKPSEEQLAEARTAAIVVRKLVEKFQPEAERSQAFGQYVDQVRKALVETETQIEQRSVAASQLAVVNAQQVVEKKAPQPTDAQFQTLANTIAALEKTLSTVHTKEPSMAKTVGEAEWALSQSKKTMQKRRLEVDIERQMGKVEEARKIASAAMQQLQVAGFGTEQLNQADAAVKLIGTVLESGKALIEADKNYAWYDGEIAKRIGELNDKITIKKIALAAREGTKALKETISTAKAKIDAAKKPEAKDSDVVAAEKAVQAITQRLETQAELEKQDRGYAEQAEKVRYDLPNITELLEVAKLARELRKKTGEALAAGIAASAQGSSSKDLHARKGQYEKAMGFFRSCQNEGTQLTQALPLLTKLPVLVEGKPLMPGSVMELCSLRATETEQLMKELAPMIKFEDGPKKSFEAGRAFLQSSKKAEALEQYNECISTGILVQHDYPQMTDQKFDIAGGPLTLKEIIAQCVAQRKALIAK